MTTRPTAHRRRGRTAAGAAMVTAVGLLLSGCGSAGAGSTAAPPASPAHSSTGTSTAPTTPVATGLPTASSSASWTASTTASATLPTAKAPGQPAVLPVGFAVDQVSTVSLLDWWVLGTGGDGSVALATTLDGGRSWTVPTLPAAVAGAARHADDSAAALGIAFSDAAHGILAVGGTALVTADGGAHWRPGHLGGTAVLAVAATPDAVFALVSTRAGFGLDRAAVGSVDLTPVLGAGRLTDTIPALATSGNTVVVVSGNRRLVSGDDGRTFTAAAGPCAPDLGGRVAAAGHSVAIWCATGTMGGGFVSTDAGVTVTAVPAATGSNGTPAAPTGAGATLVWGGATTGVNRETSTGAVVTSGRQLHHVSWLGFATPTDGFAVAAASDSGPGLLWRTHDGGATWTRPDLP